MAEQDKQQSSARFANITDTDLREILEGKDSKATKAATKYSVVMFQEYLKEMDYPLDFENAERSVLNSVLTKFYAVLRNKKGELYKSSSLLAIRSGLARHLSKSSMDAIKDVEFKGANEIFQCMSKVISNEGKGDVQHKRSFGSEDLKKLYSSLALDIRTPTGLLNKVWFKLYMYFYRRGSENQREMQADMFEFHIDDKECKYVAPRSQSPKNHQGVNREVQENTVRMSATNTNICPVASLKLLQKRKPKCNAFFQRPKYVVFFETGEVWYDNRPVGKTLLGK